MTILFLEDYDRFPGCVIDTQTPNTAFLRQAALYRDMGIKNHSAILTTLDPELIGVDPFAPNLSNELKLRIAIECKSNFWWLLRNVSRDPAGSNEFPLPFRPNRGIIAAYWLFLNHIMPLLIMIRQTGKSFGIDWLVIWLLNLRMTNSEISYITKDEKLRGREIERIKAMELTLPTYLKQRGRFDPGNTEVLRVSSLNNTFKCYLPNKSKKLADLIGRGMTAPIVIGDELAYLHNNNITIPVMLSSTLAARQIAEMKNEPHGVIFMTTSGKRDTPEGKYAYKMLQDSAVWTEKMFDLRDQKELTEFVMNASPAGKLQVNCTFNHRQLGQTDEWLKQRLKDSQQEDPVQIKADFLNEWPSGTTSTPFSAETAQMIRDSEVLDFYTEIAPPESYALRWYYSEDEIARRMQEPHVLSCDPSEAVGRDAIALYMANVHTGETAMVASITEGNLIHFARFLADFLIKHLKVTLIIERRSMGTMIIDYLNIFLPKAGIDPFTRIYNQVVQYADDYPDRYKEIQRFGSNQDQLLRKYKPLFGWATSGSGATSRDALYSTTLNNAVKMLGTLIRDRNLVLEILGLEIRNGRVDHGEGEHDDLVIAFLLFYWLISQGRNLRHYGIDPREILCRCDRFTQQLAEKSLYDQRREQQARELVESLTEQIKNEPDDYVARRLEYDLHRAVAALPQSDRDTISADDLVTKVREERVRNRPGGFFQGDTYRGGSFGSYGGYGGFGGTSYY